MITAFLLLGAGIVALGLDLQARPQPDPEETQSWPGPLPTPPIRNGPLDFLTCCDPRATYMNPIPLAWALATRRARGRDGGAAGLDPS